MTDHSKETTHLTLPKLDQFDFHQRLASMTGTTLVTFTSAGCGSCRYFCRLLLDVRKREPDWHIFEVDAQRDPALTHEFEVFHLPSVFLFNDGQFHCQLETEARTASIISSTLDALQQPAAEAP